jgi:hypothetical protein
MDMSYISLIIIGAVVLCMLAGLVWIVQFNRKTTVSFRQITARIEELEDMIVPSSAEHSFVQSTASVDVKSSTVEEELECELNELEQSRADSLVKVDSYRNESALFDMAGILSVAPRELVQGPTLEEERIEDEEKTQD